MLGPLPLAALIRRNSGPARAYDIMRFCHTWHPLLRLSEACPASGGFSWTPFAPHPTDVATQLPLSPHSAQSRTLSRQASDPMTICRLQVDWLYRRQGKEAMLFLCLVLVCHPSQSQYSFKTNPRLWTPPDYPPHLPLFLAAHRHQSTSTFQHHGRQGVHHAEVPPLPLGPAPCIVAVCLVSRRHHFLVFVSSPPLLADHG